MPLDNAPSFCVHRFDYLIVGGGTAGLALAARLSEDPKVVVGVLEVGEWAEHTAKINTPGLALGNMRHPKSNWLFMSVPQAHANERTISQPRGKALGGSSSLTCIRSASSGEYDALEKLGNPGWNWSEFLKYMKKAETTIPTDPELAKNYGVGPLDHNFHGDLGPIVKSHPTWASELERPLINTMNALGVSNNPDAEKGDNVGVTTCFTSVDTRTAVRSYAANAYYGSNSQRPNLFLVTGAHVSKIILERNTVEGILSATGVEFIIFSAVTYEIDSTVETRDIMSEDLSRERHVELYKSQQRMLASPPSTCLTFIPTNSFASEDKMEEWAAAVGATSTPNASAPTGLRKQYEFQKGWLSDSRYAQAEIISVPGFIPGPGLRASPHGRYSPLMAYLMHPFSRGTVHISSPDPLAPPAIDPRYFSHPEDLDMPLHVLKFVLNISETEPFAGLVRSRVIPTTEDTASDETIKEYIKNNVKTVYHPIGTASMLPREDGGVVDASLRVYGTSNLRVVDCSIIPLHLSCHTQTVAYAVGEKV
ncbi:GMC oxidoreductase [Ramaria rubella]|nr:GMC oxidoreductase [Ramaria rubella]